VKWNASALRIVSPAPDARAPLTLTVRTTHSRTASLILITAALTISATAQSAEWIWRGGGSPTPYGSAQPFPNERADSTGWTDSNGNFWLFGGVTSPLTTKAPTRFSDLWEFNPAANQWTLVNGPDGPYNLAGNYGTLGVPAASNHPGGRLNAVGWADSSGNLWLFGGWGNDSTTAVGYLNDLWNFNPTTKQWTWVGGSSTVPNSNSANSCQPGLYGALGVASAANVPGGREPAAGWTDSSGNFWLFGGSGCDSTDTQGLLNDLWMFKPATQQWTWMGGSSTVPNSNSCQPGLYGTLGVASTANIPGGRGFGPGWRDSNGNFWLFGGSGCDSTGTQGSLNDLWMFNPFTQQWAWISGSSTVGTNNCIQPGIGCGQSGVYGTLGQPAPGNVPGGREGAVGAFDTNGNLWLFGGDNSAGGVGNLLNDLWKFNPQTQQWTWMSGSSTETCRAMTNGKCSSYAQDGVYGALDVFAAGNIPGSHTGGVGWADKNGHLWIFGGSGSSSSPTGMFNDLWEYAVGPASAIALTSSANPVFAPNPTTLTASVTAVGGTPTGTVTFVDGTTSIGTGTLDSSGNATLSLNTLAIGSHTLTASYSGNANLSGANVALTQVVEDFSIANGSTPTATLSAPGLATYTFTFNPVAPAATIASAITISASGGPPGSTYTFSTTTIASGSTSTLVTLLVVVPLNSAALRSVPRRPDVPLSLPFALAALLLPMRGRRDKASKRIARIAPLLLIVVGIAASASLSGCSGKSPATSSQTQTYTITVSGTAGALSHSTSVTLNVN